MEAKRDMMKKVPVREQDPKVRATNFKEVCLGYNMEEAVAESERCLNCKNAKCIAGCPVSINIPAFIQEVKAGNIEEAAKVIALSSALPAVCGRVCPQESQCEGQCVRGIKGEAVSIGKLERFVADWSREHGFVPAAPEKTNGKKVAVIGSGPAGLTCAGDLAKLGYDVTIFEALHEAGGVLVYGIPEFRLPKQKVVAAEVENVKALGVKIETNVVIGKSVTIDELMENEGFEAVFIGSGAGLPRFMGIPGEQAMGVFSANEFLTRNNLMKAFLEEYDTPIKAGKKVIVVGGGNVAVDVARAALRAGSGEVSMFCLESRDIMPAAKDEVAEAEEEGISVNNSWGPKEILTENGKVKAIVFKKCLSVKDADGRFNPQYDENDLMTVECENVLLSIGQSIVWGDLLKGTKVEIRPNGGAIADPVTYQTAEPDIFVGGDVYTGPRFAIDAIAAGKEGFVSMHRFVNPGQSLTLGRNRREFIELDKNNIDVETFDNAKRQIPGTKADVAKETFRDLRCTLTEEQIKTEAKRCLGCGASVVDENKCIGCGICTTKCEFDAIHLTRDLPDASRMWKSEDKLKAIAPYALKRQFAIKRNKN